MIFGINTTNDISKLSQISRAVRLKPIQIKLTKKKIASKWHMILESEKIFRCRNFGPSSYKVENELKMLGDNNKNAILAPLPSFLPALMTTFQ